MDLLDHSIEIDIVLFEREFGEVVIDDDSEAEAEKQDQIRQQNAIAA